MPSDRDLITKADIRRLVGLGFTPKGYGRNGKLEEAYLEKDGSDSIEIPLRLIAFAVECEYLELIQKGYVVRWWREKGEAREAWLESIDGDKVPIPAADYEKYADAARARAKADRISHRPVTGSQGLDSYGYRESDRTLEVTTKEGKTWRLTGPSPEEVAFWLRQEKKTAWLWQVLNREYRAIPHDPLAPVGIDETRAQLQASIEGIQTDQTPLYVDGAA